MTGIVIRGENVIFENNTFVGTQHGIFIRHILKIDRQLLHNGKKSRKS